jgi:cation diffusion facilitator family transporter
MIAEGQTERAGAPNDRNGSIALVAIASIVVALAAMAIKFVAYWVTGSVALYSDALEGIVNVVTGVIALVAVRVSARPADRRHPFGHHKAEYFSAVFEGALIAVAAVLILHEAWNAIQSPRMLAAPLLGLSIAAVATLLNAVWAVFLIRWGGQNRSPALVADGHHVMTDVLTSVGVMAGLVLAYVTGWPLLDPLIAAAVALNILWTGWRLTSSSLSSLMDEAVPREELANLREVIKAAALGKGAIQVHDLRTRRAGSVTFIEFHLVVPGSMTVAESHAICDRIEAEIETAMQGVEVLIHVEPENEKLRRGGLDL